MVIEELIEKVSAIAEEKRARWETWLQSGGNSAQEWPEPFKIHDRMETLYDCQGESEGFLQSKKKACIEALWNNCRICWIWNKTQEKPGFYDFKAFAPVHTFACDRRRSKYYDRNPVWFMRDWLAADSMKSELGFQDKQTSSLEPEEEPQDNKKNNENSNYTSIKYTTIFDWSQEGFPKYENGVWVRKELQSKTR